LRTRTKLIEAAGQLFAERGFDAATGQEICRRAGVHAAAIVYHFHGMRGLYDAVLAEARRRLVSTEALAAAVESQRDAKLKLESFLGVIVQALTSPVSRSWAGKLFGRIYITPSVAYGQPHDRALTGRAAILKSIVSALTGLPPEDAAVARACLSIMAPCVVLLLFDRRKLRYVFPDLRLGAEDAARITRHLADFALAGVATLVRGSDKSAVIQSGR
jgi:AcrR family transcriptional regulator